MKHGHVTPNLDGTVARCGGPGICGECSVELAQAKGAEYQCDGSTTHYQGCRCHEARHAAEVERLREALKGILLHYQNPNHDHNWAYWTAECARKALGEEES